ncbi:MAG: HAMP domain-containing protein [Proteobacteria bacterium]|nr:HAMP domain-containing protein [Pseudomonadota bacterium]
MIIIGLSVEIASTKILLEALKMRGTTYVTLLANELGFAIAAGMSDEAGNLSNKFLAEHPGIKGVRVITKDSKILAAKGEKIPNEIVKHLIRDSKTEKQNLILDRDDKLYYLSNLKDEGEVLGHLICSEGKSAIEELSWRLRTTFFLTCLVVLTIMTAIIYYVGGKFSNPLKHMAKMALNVASGKMTKYALNIESNDEIGQLGEAINQMAMALSEQVGAIQITAESVLKSTSQVMKITRQLSKTMNNQASAIAQVAALTGEMQKGSVASKENANNIVKMAKESVKVSSEGENAVEASVEETRQIRDQVETIAVEIDTFKQQILEVESIIGSVNEISGQSNLLAINASIEAAKAGKVGRGFSVVAKNVKVLSKQSEQATIQVSRTLESIQHAIKKVANRAEAGRKRAESGVKGIESTGEVISRLTETISKTSNTAQPIMESANNHFAALAQVTKAMDDIRKNAIENIEHSKRVDRSLRQLNRMASELERLVAKYRLID